MRNGAPRRIILICTLFVSKPTFAYFNIFYQSNAFLPKRNNLLLRGFVSSGAEVLNLWVITHLRGL